MHFKNLLNDRIFVSPSNSQIIFEENEELIQAIFKDSKIKIPESNQIKFIDSNYNYDIYLIYNEDFNFCLKISFNPDDVFLKNEFEILNKIQNNFTVKPIAYKQFKYGDIIHYSLTTFEKYHSLNEFGHFLYFEKIDLILNSLKEFHQLINLKKDVNFFIKQFINNNNIDYILSQHSIDLIKTKYNISIIENFISELKNDILNLSSNDILYKNEFCHGNLKASNILLRDSDVKFINFENSFIGNSYLDLASIIINLNFNKNLEKEVFSKFLLHKNISYSESEWHSYKYCYDVIIRKTLLEIFMNFFFEVFVLRQSRPFKIYQLINFYSLNIENFSKIESYKKYYKFIEEVFSETIIHKDAG